MAICHHAFHRNRLTPRVCTVINVLIWTVSVIFGMLPLMGWNVTNQAYQAFVSNSGTLLSGAVIYDRFAGVVLVAIYKRFLL